LFPNQIRMKTIFSIACCLLIVSTATSTPLPQTKQAFVTAAYNDGFVRFNAHRQQAGIALSWTFGSPNNAVSFVIERSYDGSFFERIDEVPAAGKNQYKDNGVYPGYIYYRIAALMYDGSTIYSNVDMVRIVRNG